MRDRLYQLLNFDAAELPSAEPITDQEVMNIMKRIKKETGTLTVTTRRKPNYSVIFLAAAISVACIGTATVAASKLGVFDKLKQAEKQTFELNDAEYPTDKFTNRFQYEQIADYTVKISETLQAEGENLIITAEEVYCDGRTTIIGLSGHLKNGNPDGIQLLNLENTKIFVGEGSDDKTALQPAWCDGNLLLEQGTDNTFIGAIRFITFGEQELLCPSEMELQVCTVREQANYMDDTSALRQGFTFTVDVTPNKALRHDKFYTVEKDGYSVRFYEIAPAMMIVGFDCNRNESSWLYDNNGTPLEQMQLTELPDYDDGFSIGCMQTVTSGTLTARFWNKSGEYGMPDANGVFPSTKEIIINMEEVYAAMCTE